MEEYFFHLLSYLIPLIIRLDFSLNQIRSKFKLVFKVRLSLSKKFNFICLNEKLLKMMKNAFYFVLQIFTFLSWCFGYVQNWLEKEKNLQELKGALWSLRQFLATESPLKMIKHAFYFSSFSRSQVQKKGLIRKISLISKLMTSHIRQKSQSIQIAQYLKK